MEKVKKYIPYILLAIGGIILLIRAFYSFCWSDETLYSSTAYRFLCGDRIFADEWFPTQLSSVVIMPLVAIYRAIAGSMDGIILFLRIMYVIASVALALVTYTVLSKDKNVYVGCASSIMFLFYTHLNIATLSYYTMSVQCFLIAMLLVYHYTHSAKKSHLIIAGIIFAICVLSLPTMAAAYVLAIIASAVVIFAKKKKSDTKDVSSSTADTIKNIIVWSFVGIAGTAVVFFIVLLANVSVSDFISGIPYVLSDDEHATSLIFPLRKFFISINEAYHKGAYLSYLFVIASLAGRKILLKNNLLKNLFFAGNALLFVINAMYSFGHTGYIQTALCLFALPLYILTEKRDKTLALLVYLGGMIFSIVYSYSSNGFLYVLSTGHAVASIAAVAMIYDFCSELSGKELIKHVVTYVAAAVVCYAVLTTVTLRIVNVYRDAPLSCLTETIKEGPAKGLKTTPDHNALYEEVYNIIITECNSSKASNDYILFSKLLPWGYMATDLRVAAPSCWRNGLDSPRLTDFYEANPEKYPSVIFVLSENIGTYDTCGDVEYDPAPNTNDENGWLLDYINENGYEKIETSCGTIYRK